MAPSAVARRFVLPLSGRITTQVLYADDIYVAATTAGDVVGFDRNGYVLWRDQLGQLASSCPQLDGYGVVGTGAIDVSSRTIYLADAFGRLHALALASGVERQGWPVRLFTDSGRELDWGAVTVGAGAVYVPTAAYCETPNTRGAVYRVDLDTRAVSSWLVVPVGEGGGGGPWGWGGLAFDPATGELFAGTSGALGPESQPGGEAIETDGFADQLVDLSTSLQVLTSDHPAGLPDAMDIDFVGSPLLVDKSGCGQLVVAATKNDTVYGWRRDDVADGFAWKVAVEPYVAADPFLAQLAWSPATSSVYAVTGTELVRIKVDSDCDASVAWRRQLATHTENGSPTVAGGLVWFANNGAQTLVAYDAASGARVFSAPLGGTTVEAPTIVDGRVIVGTFNGLVEGFGTKADPPPARSAAGPRTTSWLDRTHGWQSRPSGVYATDDGGKHWRRIYARPALSVAPVSRTAGVISAGFEPGTCMCATQQLWTSDAGHTWHETRTLSDDFVAADGRVYFWEGGTLRLLQPLPTGKPPARLRSTAVASVKDGTIVGATPAAGGVIALVSNRVSGQGWDNSPRVIVAHGDSAGVVKLPAAAGRPLAFGISADGQHLTVTGETFGRQTVRAVTWTSADGGASWSAATLAGKLRRAADRRAS